MSILVGIGSRENNFYAEELRRHGWNVFTSFSFQELMDDAPLFSRCEVIVLDARLLFNGRMKWSDIIAAIKSGILKHCSFNSPRILVFFTYYDAAQERIVCESKDIEGLLCHPTSPEELHYRLWQWSTKPRYIPIQGAS